jgi:hypothetical protein
MLSATPEMKVLVSGRKSYENLHYYNTVESNYFYNPWEIPHKNNPLK